MLTGCMEGRNRNHPESVPAAEPIIEEQPRVGAWTTKRPPPGVAVLDTHNPEGDTCGLFAVACEYVLPASTLALLAEMVVSARVAKGTKTEAA